MVFPVLPAKESLMQSVISGQRVALTAASSYANAQAQGEFSSSTNSEGNTTRVLTGDPTVVAKTQLSHLDSMK